MTIGDNEERQALYSENESSLIRSGLDSIAIKKAPSCRFTVENIEPTVKNSNAKCVSTTERLGDELMVEPDQIGDKHRSHSSRELFSWGSVRSKEGGAHNLALYEEPSVPFLSSFVKAYTTRTSGERRKQEEEGRSRSYAGSLFPTIQHILGVTMFIRLFWIVGIAGLGQTFLLLLLCCLCTFLTCISLSAVATNGVVESGGAYFMISRNLGPEFGSAVGLLFYLANTVATAMYLVGGTEVFLLYLFPGLTFGGPEVHQETGTWGMMTNNLRIYSTLFLILEFCIVAMGVKFVQLLAPVSLVCVIASILAVYAGGVAKTLDPSAGPYVCMYDNRLLQAKAFMPSNVTNIDDICDYCTPNNTIIVDSFLNDSTPYEESKIRCINGYPGFKSDALTR
ncbi:hypothetical protein PFISCL1PPCAC_28540, partial [Pristionchus fissidentatus]